MDSNNLHDSCLWPSFCHRNREWWRWGKEISPAQLRDRRDGGFRIETAQGVGVVGRKPTMNPRIVGLSQRREAERQHRGE